jgi:hypothetical protein
VNLFLISFAIFGLAIFGMAVGVVFSNRRIRGSCGGVALQGDLGKHVRCEGCSSTSPTCTGQGRRNGQRRHGAGESSMGAGSASSDDSVIARNASATASRT